MISRCDTAAAPYSPSEDDGSNTETNLQILRDCGNQWDFTFNSNFPFRGQEGRSGLQRLPLWGQRREDRAHALQSARRRSETGTGAQHSG